MGVSEKKVAEIAKAFGMKINIYSQDPEAAVKSDIVSLHCPATDENIGFINKEFISQMKDGAILINTARGVLVNEADLAEALKSGKLTAAGMDVLVQEPADANNPLITASKLFYYAPYVLGGRRTTTNYNRRLYCKFTRLYQWRYFE